MRQLLFGFLFAGILIFQCTLSASPPDLFEAIGYENVEELKSAIKSGGNANQVDSNLEISILMKAIETMKPDLVKVLLDAKANPNLKIASSGKTPLMYFMEKYYVEHAYSDEGAQSNAENADGIAIFKMLLKAGASVTDKDKEGNSVLSYAIQSNHVGQSEQIIDSLLDARANPNLAFNNDIKKSICLVAAEDTSGYQSTAFKLFIQKKLCDPNKEYNERNQRKTSLLYIAIQKGVISEVDALLKAGANPNKGASDTMMDYLPIFAAIKNYDLLSLLLKYKADPNSIENNTHILVAAVGSSSDDEECEKIIDLLLKSGSDINHPKLFDSYTTDNKAVYAAQVAGNDRLEKFLEKRGALKSTQLKKKRNNPI